MAYGERFVMEYKYLPAIAPGVLQEMDGVGPMHWLDTKLPSHLRYGSFLASYHVWRGKSIPYPREGMYIFGDSGGFSVVSTGASIDPRRSLRWQMRNCTMGVILDIPPFAFGGKSRFTGSAADVWDLSVERTRSNVRAALPEYMKARESGAAFRWWGVVQGESYAQIEAWYDAVSDLYPFEEEGEGWALAPKPCNDHIRVARYLRLAREKGIKRVHVLQTSKVSAVGVALALAKMAGVEFITNDSATNHINAGNRNAFLPDPDGLGGRWGGAAHHQGWEGVRTYLLERCSCPSCIYLRVEGDVEIPSPARYYKDRLVYHNFLMLIQVLYRLSAEANKDPDALLRRCAGDDYGVILREFHGEGVRVESSDKKTISVFDRL